MFDARASFNLVTVNTPCLFENKKFAAVAIGFLIGISAFCIALFVVADKSTDTRGPHIGMAQTEQNLGVQYRSSWQGDKSRALGVTRLFAIPIWDNGQGLGNRMPNLITQPTQSPTIFFGARYPVEYIVAIRNFIVMTAALIVMNLTVLSWSGSNFRRRLLFLDISLLGQYFLYASVTNWYHQADQFWGMCLIISGFLHSSWYQPSNSNSKTSRPAIVFLAFVLGLSNLLTGHVLYFQIFFFATAFFAIVHLSKMRSILGLFPLLLLLTLAGVLVVPQMIELASQVWNTQTIPHTSQPSLFDFFQPRDRWVYRFQPILAFIAASFQPILRLINDAGPRTEFLNFLFIIYLVRKYTEIQSSSTKQMLRVSLGAFCLLLLGAAFLGTVQRSKLPLVSKLFDFHVWQLSQPMLILILFTATITLGNVEQARKSVRRQESVDNFVLVIAVVMALLYPVVMITKNTHITSTRLLKNELAEENIAKSPELLGFSKGLRHIFVDGGETKAATFKGFEDLEIQRAGYPSIASIIYGRSSNTLKVTEQSFRSVISPSTADCQAEVLDFLAISAIVSEYTKSSDCRTELSTYFGSETERTIKSAAGDDLAFVNKPKVFSSWSIADDASSNPTESCPLFEKDCLSGLIVAKLEVGSRAPFKLCESECLFTYEWVAPLTSKQVLVPENYDKTIEVLDQVTGVKLRTANYQGLLAVSIPSGATSGVFEATIRPDAMMWVRVSATYIHTLIWILTVILILIRGLRGRKRSALAGTGSNDESSSQISH